MLVAGIVYGWFFLLFTAAGTRSKIEAQQIRGVWGTELEPGGVSYTLPHESEASAYPTNWWPLAYSRVLGVTRALSIHYDDAHSLAVVAWIMWLFTSIVGLAAAGKRGKVSNHTVQPTRASARG